MFIAAGLLLLPSQWIELGNICVHTNYPPFPTSPTSVCDYPSVYIKTYVFILILLIPIPQGSEELAIPAFAENPPDRCYHCKKALFRKLIAFAQANGLNAVLEGSNIDDDGDYRPGRRAIKELGIRSPLHDAGLTKGEIRELSKKLGLPTADKPSFACLASRFPYGERITAAGLERVEKAEQWLLDAGLGLTQLRVRSHGDVARIEVPPEAIARIAARAEEVAAALKGFGFAYVALDLQGYRTGSMNESLSRRPAVDCRLSNVAGQ